MVERRSFLGAASSVVVGTFLAGCTGDGGEGSPTGTATDSPEPTEPATPTPSPTPTEQPAVEVAVGPERRLRFDPEEIEIAVGTTVVWTFESTGHNVTSLPGASEKCENPAGAEPFASYEGDDHFSLNEPGTTFEHQFTVPGEYVYVCAPHEDQGMVGYITVTE